MKTGIRILAISAILFLFACEKDGENDNTIKNIILTRVEAEAVESGTDFSFNLFREVAVESSYENVFISPLSVHIANCMLANSAEGETFSEIVRTLGYDGFDIKDVNSAYKTIVKDIKKVDTSTKLQIANALWIDEKFPVSKSYSEIVLDNYDATVKNIDFGHADAVKTINKWSSQHTEKMIPEIIGDIDAGTVAFMTNAVCFQGKWKEKFDVSNTSESKFSTIDAKVTRKEYMHIQKEFNYSESADGKIQMCELPYGNGAFVMDIILPGYDVDFKAFIGDLGRKDWREMFTYSGKHKVDLSLPKFKLETDNDITRALNELGMRLPYDQQNADFSRMCSTSDQKVWISKTIQKAIIEVDESGSKAAAVTKHRAKGFGDVSSQMIGFNCDHPFVFIIRETSSDVILFMGMLTQ